MCIVQLSNTSIIHIFYRTQVLRIVKKFSKIFNKIFSYTKHVLNIFVLLPHSQPKNFQKTSSLTFTNFFTFQRLKLALLQSQDFCFQSFFASALLVTFVENELSLEPWLFKTSSLLVQIPATVCSQLIVNITLSFFNLKSFPFWLTHVDENSFSNKPMADTKKEHEMVKKLSIITWTKLSVKVTDRNWTFLHQLNRLWRKKSNRLRLFSLLKYGTFQNETHATHAYHIWNKPMHITSETNTLELLKPKVRIYKFYFSNSRLFVVTWCMSSKIL